MRLVVKDIVKETQDAVTLCFKNGSFFRKLKYKPGQFLTINTVIDNKTQKRAYSFSSAPNDDKDLKITIKRVENGLVSNYIHDHVKKGDKIEVDTPSGSFFVEPMPHAKNQYVLFAGGSGVTPMFSILKSVLKEEKNSKVLLIYANQNEESIIFHEAIKVLEVKYPDSFNVEHVLAKNTIDASNYHSGLMTESLLTHIFKKHNLLFDKHSYMICGPNGFMEKAKELLKDKGVDRNQIKIEVFKAPKVKISGKNLISNVTLKFNNETHNIQVRGDQSILQKAMSENIPLPYSCRSGMCSTCKGTCVSGTIKMTDGHLLTDDAVNKEEILTCISYPESEEVLIEL